MVHYTPNELLEFSQVIYTCLNPGKLWECVLRVWNNGGKNIKLDQAKFIDVGSCWFEPWEFRG